tara:strand:+ start:2141 stop:2614 length:474 start_codon:yes stop_codon:yes gene_type:complete
MAKNYIGKPPRSNISGSKPSLNSLSPNLGIEFNHKLANINTEGIMENQAGPIYMTHSFVEDITTTIETGDRVDSITVTTDTRCCELVDSLVTDVSFTEAETVTGVAIVDNKDEVFLNVLYIDDFNKIKEVVASATTEDSYHGKEWKQEPVIDGEYPI